MLTQNEDLYIEDGQSNYRSTAGVLTALLIRRSDAEQGNGRSSICPRLTRAAARLPRALPLTTSRWWLRVGLLKAFRNQV